MKHILLLAVVGLLLAGCGLADTAQDNLSNAVSQGWDEGVAALKLNDQILENGAGKVWTDMRPLPGTNVALVNIFGELEGDALKLGGDGPHYLYGGGLLQLKGDEAIFVQIKGNEGFSTEGDMRLWGFQPESGGQSVLVDWLLEQKNLAGFGSFGTKGLIPAEALKLGDDGSIDEIVMASVITAGNGVESTVLTTNENITAFKAFLCDGRMIPGSNQASLKYIAQTDDDQIFVGAGIGVMEGMPAAKANTAFDCGMAGKGGFISHATVENVEGAQISDLIIEDMNIQTENGQSTSIVKIYVAGFNIGMPPGLVLGDGNTLGNFNIGMPPSLVLGDGNTLGNFNIGMPPS